MKHKPQIYTKDQLINSLEFCDQVKDVAEMNDLARDSEGDLVYGAMDLYYVATWAEHVTTPHIDTDCTLHPFDTLKDAKEKFPEAIE